ncbi:MAG TPA: squalene/phytoene synthase family protein [Thermoanaerobaculia bacterium]|nr:squalene/phytoene synthase family protein [Thermoanaerobaculia bacterium]
MGSPLFEELLAGTSRTFAATIPLLAVPLREQVTVAYLLFRLADTLEDAPTAPATERAQALKGLAAELSRGTLETLPAPPGLDEPHRQLFANAPALAAAVAAFPETVREAIVSRVAHTALGMAEVVLAADSTGRVELASEAELERYCYLVAGVVGEMLTDLFVAAAPQLAAVRAELDRDAALFGEALQLVNILKDREGDAREGRRFLPRGLPLATVFGRAREDTRRGARYIATLATGGAPADVLAFTRFPLAVAIETLDAIETRGPGAKIGRERVGQLLEAARRGTLEVPLSPSGASEI